MPKIIENVRETILNIAKYIVINEDYDHLTMRRVSEESGIAVGTIYNYFPTKRSLMIQLLEDYWYEYLEKVENIDKTESSFYLKLEKIFEKLEIFINDFVEVLLKNSGPGYDDNARERRDIFTEKLIRKIEQILINAHQTNEITLMLPPYELAKFIFMNLLMMAQMKQFNYKEFEKIIKKVLE